MKKKTLIYLLPFLGLIFCCREAQGAIRTETIEYWHGDVVLEGHVAYDET
ncbi:MAG: hypothetical protein AB2L14_33215 [Candidatus Xenobiia bacterium LiM19]